MISAAANAAAFRHHGGRIALAAARFSIAPLLFALVAGCAPKAADAPVQTGEPTRIVSMNPCVDSILMEVADPADIAAISHYSHDPLATSVPLDWARKFPAVSGAAEDVIAARPDLVIAGPHVALPTLAALERLGVPVLKIAVPQSVAQSKEQIATIATRIGRVDAGRALNARIDQAIARAQSKRPPVRALIWQGGGLVPGKDTLADELLMQSGFRNISADLGLSQWDILPIERMIYTPPAVLLTGAANMGESQGEANRMLSHPVLRKARKVIRIAHYPSSLLNCGGPTIIPAVERLAQVRMALERRP
jgi:iron complex transport system substrate-binding protein